MSFTVRLLLLLLLSQALGISRAPTHRFSSCCYKKCPQGGALLCVSLRLLGQQVLWPKSWSWVVDYSGLCHGSGLMTSSPISCTPREIPSPPQTALLKVLRYSGGATARKVSAGGNPPTRKLRDQGLFKALSAQRVHHLGGALGLAEL